MTRKTRQSIRSSQVQALRPEYLLLLTIFGSKKLQHQVYSELDRRAAVRPRHVCALATARQLQPAA